MAQNENISLSLANKIDVLNKTQSVDARYGVYDTEEDALNAMADYGLDGRQVAVYTDKANGKVRLYLYNQAKHQLEPISGVTDGDKGDIIVSDTGQSWDVHKLLNVSQPGKDQIPKVLPDGTLDGEDVGELWVYDDTTTPYTLSQLQALYGSGNNIQGFEVRCRQLTPPTTYRLESVDGLLWIKIEGSHVV